MIYVPDIENYECFYIQSEGVIRAYESVPTRESTINYRDYYINSDYIYKDGSQSFNSYSTLPVCLSSDIVTNDIYYRTDLADILFIFFIFSIFCVYIPLKIFMRLFRRFN